MAPAQEKVKLRKRFRSAIARLTAEEKQEASAGAQVALRETSLWQGAAAILFYAPLSDEVDLWPLAEAALKVGKRVALPRFVSDESAYALVEITDLQTAFYRGPHGVREPSDECPIFPQNDLDLLLIPGLGFSWEGVRIGRGKGYYDRLLANAKGIKCGVGFDCQIADGLPTEPHDILLDFILTPTFGLAAVNRSQA